MNKLSSIRVEEDCRKSLSVGIVLFSLLILLPSFLFAQVRTQVSLNEGWSYYANPTQQVTALQATGGPVAVNLPHTWNQWDATDNVPGYRRDASWYWKSLPLKPDRTKRYILYFEGANISTEVYVNQQLAGKHIGGYVGFEIDITDYLKRSGKNEIAVRVDNSYNPEIIPTQKSDFFIYGGITRDVWLKTLPKDFIQQARVNIKKVSDEQAQTELEVTLSKATTQTTELEAELYDPSGKLVCRSNRVIAESNSTTLAFPTLSKPALWSPETPNLYVARVITRQKGAIVDTLSISIGYRWFSFEPHGAFLLNGKRLKLRGTHRHEEHAGYGGAVPNAIHRLDIAMIKGVGANFIRLAHYPQDPEVYRACDSLGLIVWDELPWCRGGMGNDAWQANTLRLLEEQIRQNRNHPSICFWSLGNEMYWLPDFDGGDNPERLDAFLRQLNEKAHTLDPTRLTAIRKYPSGAKIVDTYSPSIWSGWYAGIYQNYGPTLAENRAAYPQFLHMEYGGSSHVGRHTEQPIDNIEGINDANWAEVANQADIESIANSGDWSENYIVDLFDWYLHVSENTDWFAGNAQWAFKDFATPLRPENGIPYMNQKGLTDRSGKPKDAYYVFQSYWSPTPMVYIESATWTERTGTPGEQKIVDVYSNCARVELWLNGVSLGEKNRDPQAFPACGLRWPLAFAEGKNTLLAIGRTADGQETRDTLQLNYHTQSYGKPSEIKLEATPLPNGNLLIVATMVDQQGRRVLNYENRVYFSHDGSGKLLINYGTPTRSQVVEFANGRAAIEFVPGRGGAVIEARNQDFKGTYLRIP